MNSPTNVRRGMVDPTNLSSGPDKDCQLPAPAVPAVCKTAASLARQNPLVKRGDIQRERAVFIRPVADISFMNEVRFLMRAKDERYKVTCFKLLARWFDCDFEMASSIAYALRDSTEDDTYRIWNGVCADLKISFIESSS